MLVLAGLVLDMPKGALHQPPPVHLYTVHRPRENAQSRFSGGSQTVSQSGLCTGESSEPFPRNQSNFLPPCVHFPFRAYENRDSELSLPRLLRESVLTTSLSYACVTHHCLQKTSSADPTPPLTSSSSVTKRPGLVAGVGSPSGVHTATSARPIVARPQPRSTTYLPARSRQFETCKRRGQTHYRLARSCEYGTLHGRTNPSYSSLEGVQNALSYVTSPLLMPWLSPRCPI
jgi:hypothetical protein